MITFSSRATKWVAIALTVSLAINLFLAGAFAARWFAPRSPFGFVTAGSPAGERGPTPALERMAGRLPAAERDKFRATAGQYRERIVSAAGAVRDARRKVSDVMIAEQVDRPALDAALRDLRARTQELGEVSERAFIEAAAPLSADARKRLVGSFGRPGPRDR